MNNVEKYNEQIFENIKHVNEYGQEFWYARELQVALEELLFEHAHNAKVQYDNRCSAIRYERFLELCDLIEDAGLGEEYDDWKEEKGYE